MTTQRIVVGIDGSAGAQAALAFAAEEARIRGASLEVLHVWSYPVMASYSTPTTMVDPGLFEDNARRLVDDAVAGVDMSGLEDRVQKLACCGSPTQELVDAAKGADLVVVGSRGRGGFIGLLLGSVSQQVVQHSPCPVVVVPPAERS